MQHRAQVHVDQQVDVLRVGLEELLWPVDARVVDQDVELDLVGEPAEPSSSVTSMTCGMQPVRVGQSLQRFAERATAWTSRPSRQNRSTTAAPIPDEAPVTRAVL